MVNFVKTTLEAPDGREIPCIYNLCASDKAVIVCHGFSSSKESETGSSLASKLSDEQISVFCFDFPAHGSSKSGASLTVDNCLCDLAEVEKFVRKLIPGAKIGYFGSSFGAYIAILYSGIYKESRGSIFLRSAAAEMPELFLSQDYNGEMQAEMEKNGFFYIKEDFAPDIMITSKFIEDLKKYSVYRYFVPGKARIAMVHGGRDTIADLASAERFSAFSGAVLTVFPSGSHRLIEGDIRRKVMDLALDFFEQMQE